METMPITVAFKASIRTDGELERVIITQSNNEIRLTEKQAISLASQLTMKFGQDQENEKT